MTEWTLLKRLLDAVHHHSTMIGRLWLTVMVIFRLLIVAVATEDVYMDEQEMFVCNTLQPGCSTVCYDAFAPISQPRFWVFHIISVSTPSLCFLIYTWHSLSKPPQNGTQRPGKRIQKKEAPYGGQESKQETFNLSCDSDSCSIRSHKHLGHSLADVLEGINPKSLPKRDLSSAASLNQAAPCTFKEESAAAQAVSAGVLSNCYIFHVWSRAILEIGFVLAQWKLFGFKVPVRFLCTSSPCSQPVDCYVSRPTEKTIFLLFMFCVGVFCILLNLLELNHLGLKKFRRAVRMRKRVWGGRAGAKRGYETFMADSSSATSSLGFREVSNATSLPTLDLVVINQPEWTYAANACGIREPPEVRETRAGPPKTHDSCNGERQPLKSKKTNDMCKQRSAEVWI